MWPAKGVQVTVDSSGLARRLSRKFPDCFQGELSHQVIQLLLPLLAVSLPFSLVSLVSFSLFVLRLFSLFSVPRLFSPRPLFPPLCPRSLLSFLTPLLHSSLFPHLSSLFTPLSLHALSLLHCSPSFSLRLFSLLTLLSLHALPVLHSSPSLFPLPPSSRHLILIPSYVFTSLIRLSFRICLRPFPPPSPPLASPLPPPPTLHGVAKLLLEKPIRFLSAQPMSRGGVSSCPICVGGEPNGRSLDGGGKRGKKEIGGGGRVADLVLGNCVPFDSFV